MSDPSLSSSFTDADGTDDPTSGFRYIVSYKPEGVLIHTNSGFVAKLDDSDPLTGTGSFNLVILKKPKNPFNIELYARDGDNTPSNSPVKLKVAPSIGTTLEPISGSYLVQQDDDGDFKEVRIGNRLDVKHSLTFDRKFDFAKAYWETYITGLDSSGTKSRHTPNTAFSDTSPSLCAGNKKPESLSPAGAACYTYITPKKVDILVEGEDASDFSTPVINFNLPAEYNGLNGGKVSIRLRYHVWAFPSPQNHSPLPSPEPQRKMLSSPEKSLTLNIHKCVVTTDCPIDSSS